VSDPPPAAELPSGDAPDLSPAELDALLDRLIKASRAIDAGFVCFRIAVAEPDTDADTLSEMRFVFFADAQHLLNLMLDAMETGGRVPAICRNTVIAELQEFAAEMELRREPTQGNA